MFKLDGLDDPKPFKLWERTKQWTLEDATLFGGATGLLLASNPRLFPGVTGFGRFFGVTIAGFAIGAKTGEWVFDWAQPYHAKRVAYVLAMQRRATYRRLSQDENAKAQLSRFGQALLLSYTGDSPLMRILSKPFGGLSGTANPRSATVAGHGQAHQGAQTEATRQIQMQQAHTKQPIHMLAEFDKEELAAPDYDRGFRQFRMDPTETDLDTLQEYLEYLKKLRASDAMELASIWQSLAQKEHKMHQLSQEDPEKDLLIRECQLLNSIAVHFNTRIAILAYAQADAGKRICQIRNEGAASGSTVPLPATEGLDFDDASRENLIPQKTTERIRQRWETARSDVAQVELLLSHCDQLKSQGGMTDDINEQVERIRKEQGQLKKHVVATERLLKEYEDQIHKADNNHGK